MVDELGEQGGDPGDLAERDQDGLRRDQAAERRDTVGGLRDDFGDVRDAHGDKRDVTGQLRDLAGDERDVAADLRDRLAAQVEESSRPTPTPDALRVAARARRAAASDRRWASQDRLAGAGERTKSERDRRAGASERLQSEHDRSTALADRTAAAMDRDSASIDGLTGAHARDAGLVELAREMTRAQRTAQPLSLAFVDVDHLKTFNDSCGHASGDHKLIEVVEAIRAKMRSYDLIVRVGGDEFLCALPGLDETDAAGRLASLNASLSTSAQPVSVTVGIAEMEAGDTPATLIARADADLYELRRRQRLP